MKFGDNSPVRLSLQAALTDTNLEFRNVAMFKFGFFDEPEQPVAGAEEPIDTADDIKSDVKSTIVEFKPPSQPWVEKPVFTSVCDAGAHRNIVQLVAAGSSGTADGTSLSGVTSHADVKTGVYEGGFKTWECTKDLICFIAQPTHTLPSGASVLDLGCGPGLAGCAALQQGCNVLFQDLNTDVLRASTSAHIHSNCPTAPEEGRVALLAGAWAAQPDFLQAEATAQQLPSWASSGRFDFILSSETLYREAYFKQLLHALLAAMHPDTQVLLATKRFYFGVGGGTRPWIEFLANTLGPSTHEQLGDSVSAAAAAAGAGAGAGGRSDRSPVPLYTSPPLSHETLESCGALCLAGRCLLLERVWSIADGGSNVRDVLKLSTQATE